MAVWREKDTQEGGGDGSNSLEKRRKDKVGEVGECWC